jgi:hypothetical protein
MRLSSIPDPLPPLSSQSDDPDVPTRFARIVEGLAAIDRRGPDNLSSKALHEELEWFTTRLRAMKAISARWQTELDRREQEARADDHHPGERALVDDMGEIVHVGHRSRSTPMPLR